MRRNTLARPRNSTVGSKRGKKASKDKKKSAKKSSKRQKMRTGVVAVTTVMTHLLDGDDACGPHEIHAVVHVAHSRGVSNLILRDLNEPQYPPPPPANAGGQRALTIRHITLTIAHFLRRERGQGKKHFPCSADHEQDWHLPTRLILTLASCVMTIHIHIHTYLCTRTMGISHKTQKDRTTRIISQRVGGRAYAAAERRPFI